MPSFLSRIRANLWRFPTSLRECEDWARHLWANLRERYDQWRFWYSPPWRKDRLCPGCAGAKGKSKYDHWRECEVCNGVGRVLK